MPAVLIEQPTLTYPPAGGNILENYNPDYTWNKLTGALYYRLYVSGPSGVVLDQWYEALSICSNVDNKCRVASPTLTGGAYVWYVQSWNPAGYGPWSNNTQPTNFSTTITVPVAATLFAPKGSILTDYTPTYKWNKVATATYYRLYVSGPSGVVLDQWYKAADICLGVIVGQECSVASPTLTGGAYVWYVQTYSPAGYGPWSNNTQPTNFNSTIPAVPAAAVLSAPKGNILTDYNPTYTWTKVTTATYYRLYVSGPSGVVLDQWYQASGICSDVDSKCKVVSPTLAGGAYAWYVQTYNPSGYGPWSNNTQPTNFSTTVPRLPAGATLTAPIGTITNPTPTYTWTKVNMAVWYRLYVNGPSGVVKDQWYQAVEVCDSVTNVCSVSSPKLERGDHIWWVQTYSGAGYGPWKSASFKVNP